MRATETVAAVGLTLWSLRGISTTKNKGSDDYWTTALFRACDNDLGGGRNDFPNFTVIPPPIHQDDSTLVSSLQLFITLSSTYSML